MEDSALLLAIDTCGPSGSVALGRIVGSAVEILEQKELAGRTYSATVIMAIGELLSAAELKLEQLRAIVVVNGPGSFTGVRVGLSAAKGLAEGASLPVVAVSRLEVLAFKAGISAAALDAHRHELFFRYSEPKGTELLAGAHELAQLRPAPSQIAICDKAAAELLGAVWPAAELINVPPPSAADALHLFASNMLDGESDETAFADLALLDGHYLRRSDAEIFGDPAAGRHSA